MATVQFTQNLQRHVQCPPTYVAGDTVGEVLNVVFSQNPRLKGYVLDDQGALRYHMTIFVDGEQIHDRIHLSDSVTDDSRIYVLQTLSGGETS